MKCSTCRNSRPALLHRSARVAGAEVVKVENPGGGEPGRTAFPGPQGSPSFVLFLRVQRRQEVGHSEFKIRNGLALVKEIAKKADVMIENMAPATIERLGPAPGNPCPQPRHHLCPGQGVRRG